MPPKGVILILSLLTNTWLGAQTLPFEKYTTKNGLPSDRITAIAQDEKGFMWFGSYFGICRYDGVQFKKIDLPFQQKNEYVTCLLPASNKMYAGFLFGGGLAEYTNEKTQSYFIKGKDSARANEFVCMYDSKDGSIILGNTIGQLYLFKDGIFNHLFDLQLPAGLYPRYVQKDGSNTLWIGTDKGLYLLPPPYQAARKHFAEENIISLLKDANNNLVFTRTNGTLTVTQKASGSQNGVPTNIEVLQTSDQVRLAGPNGNTQKGIWFVDAQQQLININGKEKQQFKISIDLTTDARAIYCDRENNIWIANDPGVLKISNFNIQSYRFDEIAAGGGTLSIANDSLIWVSNSKNLYAITPAGLEKKVPEKNQVRYYGFMHSTKSDLFIGYWDDGLLKATWKNKNVSTFQRFLSYKKAGVKAQSIVEDGSGNIWVGGANGVFHIKGNAIVAHVQPLNAAGQPVFVTSMALDEGSQTLWLGDNASGVIRVQYQFKGNGLFSYKTLGYVNIKEGLKDTYVRSLLFDQRNNLWIGTRFGGIYKLSIKDGKSTVQDYNSNSKITCNRISDIAAQDTVAVWFATCDGLHKYEYATDKWTHYNMSDGLINSDIFSIRYDKANKVIWAVGSEGVNKLLVSHVKDTIRPLINITSLNISGKDQTTALFTNHELEFPSNTNSIRIEFAGASFSDEKQITYKYILEGRDKEWSVVPNRNFVSYHLPPGHYTFKVYAINKEGNISAKPAVLTFTIQSPFWEKRWFLVFSFLAAIAVVYFIYRYRLQQLVKLEKLRSKISSDLHDDLGSTLSSISILSEVAIQECGKPQSNELVKEIKQNSILLMDKMDDIIWSVNPKNDSFENLLIRIKRFASQLFEARDIDYSITIDDSIRHLPLSMEYRQHIYLIIKEAVNNIVKYSNCTQAQIFMEEQEGYLYLVIKDNGTGFDKSAFITGNGLLNMKARAAQMRARMDIKTSKGEGTKIIFRSKIK